jgi:hypothetical protein
MAEVKGLLVERVISGQKATLIGRSISFRRIGFVGMKAW